MTVDERQRLTSRTQLVDALAVACELEHGLSLQYLFAAFSIRKEVDEGLGDAARLIMARRWASMIFFVAAQEMLHLAQAANLLIAVGGAPHLARPNFPQPAGTYPPELGWELTAFSLPTLDRFIAYETPRPDPPLRSANDPIVPSRLTHATIGQMYEEIAAAFRDLDVGGGNGGGGGLFIGRPGDQLVGELVGFPQLVQVTDRATAAEAITLIVDQGEGTARDHVDSHFGMFTTIRDEYAAELARDPTFEPARPVADNPLAEPHTDVDARPSGDDVNLIEDETTRAVQDLCTASYDALLLTIFRFFAGGGSDPAAPMMQQVTLELMMTVIRPLGELLTRLPMGARYGSLTAGPSFECFPEVELLPHPAAARLVIAERLAETAVAARRIELRPAQAPVLTGVASRLEALAALLTPG